MAGNCTPAAKNSGMAGVFGVWFFNAYASNSTRSKYKPRPGCCFADAMNALDAAAKARPGGKASAFCEPVRA